MKINCQSAIAMAWIMEGCLLNAAHAQILEGIDPGIGGPPDIVIHQPRGVGPSADNPGQGFDHSRAASGAASTSPIIYHGGPVMSTSPINVYYIWYGNWSGSPAVSILDDLARNVAPSPYFNINTTYSDPVGPVPNAVQFKGEAFDSYSLGKRKVLSDSDIVRILNKNFTKLSQLNGNNGWDPNGVYFVLTSQDVKKSGFCTSYCGWHTYGTATQNGSSVSIKYSFVGNPAQCINNCAAQSVGPNGDAGADGMASIILHELEEAATDPLLNAWYDASGYENADKCAWTFGGTYKAANGALANMKLGNRDFLIQQNWVNANGGYCALSY